jgi:3-(3-hydroxy-phenyl)propionate hydroxylase
MPDLDLVTADGPLRVYTGSTPLLHDAKPVLLNLGEPDGSMSPGWETVQIPGCLTP